MSEVKSIEFDCVGDLSNVFFFFLIFILLELLESFYQLMLLPTQKYIWVSNLHWEFGGHYTDSFFLFVCFFCCLIRETIFASQSWMWVLAVELTPYLSAKMSWLPEMYRHEKVKAVPLLI